MNSEEITCRLSEGQRRRAERLDAPYVEMIRKALEDGNYDIRTPGDSRKLRRVIKRYFPGDPRTDLFFTEPHKNRYRSMNDRTARWISMAIAEGAVGVKGVADHIGMGVSYVSTFINKHGIEIPRASVPDEFLKATGESIGSACSQMHAQGISVDIAAQRVGYASSTCLRKWYARSGLACPWPKRKSPTKKKPS